MAIADKDIAASTLAIETERVDRILAHQRARVMCGAVAVPLFVLLAAGLPRLALYGGLAGIVSGFCDVPTTVRRRIEGLVAVLVLTVVSAATGMMVEGHEPLIVAATLVMAAIASAVPAQNRVAVFGARYATIAFNIGAHQPLSSTGVVYSFGLAGLAACGVIAIDGLIWPHDLPEHDHGLRADMASLRRGETNPRLFVVCAAVTVAIALLVADTYELKKPYWVMLTALVVMHPDMAAGIRRIAERAMGVTVGAIIVLGIGSLIREVWILAVLAALFAYATPRGFRRSYGAGCAMATVLVMLLFDVSLLAQGGSTPYLWPRVLDTIVGCGFAMGGTLAYWLVGNRAATRRTA